VREAAGGFVWHWFYFLGLGLMVLLGCVKGLVLDGFMRLGVLYAKDQAQVSL